MISLQFGLKSDPDGVSIILQSGRIKKHYCKDSSSDVKDSQLKLVAVVFLGGLKKKSNLE